MNLSNTSISKVVYFLLVTCIMAGPIIYQAYINKLFVFDESYYFIASYELGEHGRFFIKFDPSSQLLNTKPYLFVFFQILFGKVFGWNEWSLRLPTMLSSITLLWMLFFFIKRTFNDSIWAVTAVMVLLVIPYFVHPHMAFTGDHDIPLTMFLTGYIFSLFLFLTETNRGKQDQYILFACVCATASILTKGWMIVFFLPPSLFFILVYKKLHLLINNKLFWYGILSSIAIVMSWYFGREYLDPGYLKAFWEYEIGRFRTDKYAENPEWTYYWKMLFFVQLKYWLLALIPTLYFLIKGGFDSNKKFVVYIGVMTLSFLSVMSFSKLKLLWYDAPVLPLFAMVCGYGIALLFKYISTWLPLNPRIIIGILLLGLFLFPYLQIFNRTFNRFHKEAYGDFMMTKQTDASYTIVYPKYNPHLLFYEQYAKKAFNQAYLLKKSVSSLKAGEKILICEKVLLSEINKKFEYVKKDSLGDCVFIEIEKSR
jgi:4-amino-4-deoxy-L-arabinose transferase-like glycosyltransferase